MPNRWTFQIKPIANLLKEEMNSGVWLDPFAGKYSPATVTNDINPAIKAQYHLDALDFLKEQKDQSFSGVLLDPPYSKEQFKRSYELLGLTTPPEIYTHQYQQKIKQQISRIVVPGGKAICFGWDSNGIGKTRGFMLERLLIVPHGSAHYDTIVTVERKMNGSLF